MVTSVQALPRVVIAAPGSGHGKTTVASGLMAAFRRAGLTVAGFKIGPDYIDPGYHTLATGRPGRNLDPHLCAPDLLVPLLLHGAATPTPADVAVVEGVMGLFDGRVGAHGFASTAHVASLISAPVVLVLDVSHMSRTAAALVRGLDGFQPDTRVGGVIMNKVGSARHAREISTAVEDLGIPVFGALPRDAGIEAPSRHLGLVPAAERPQAADTLDRLADRIAQHLELDRLLGLARSAPRLAGSAWQPELYVRPPAGRTPRICTPPVVAMAGGRAFTFRYAETEELIRAAGCDPVPFDPMLDAALPERTCGLYLGGGFPEMYASDLAANRALLEAIGTAVNRGIPTVAECAGLLYLCQSVDGQALVGAIDATAAMSPRLTLGYRTAVADHDHLLACAGGAVAGHEFHRTAVTPPSAPEAVAWLADGEPDGFSLDPAATGQPTLHASYLHVHWAGYPSLAQRFCDAVHAFAQADDDGGVATTRGAGPHRHDLRHHGDAEVGTGLVDLAVNVRVAEPPDWLAQKIMASVAGLGTYPKTEEAALAIAGAHRVPRDHVLPTAGAAEAFTLVARARQWAAPLVVHPQFTEPEAALRAAGYQPRRLLLSAAGGFLLDPTQVPSDSDLVIIGNPTNPTATLHPAGVIDRLRRPGRVLCVDEAFMDAVPGEPESMLRGGLSGVLVLRSLTKTWGLAGLRAGYVVGDPAVVRDLSAQQPMWSVSSPAAAAMVACLSPSARREAEAAAVELAERRAVLAEGLASVGLMVAGRPEAPFVLVDTFDWVPGRKPGWVRAQLRERGFAVRRGDTFPGLDGHWVRLAVRDPDTTATLVKTLAVIKESAGG